MGDRKERWEGIVLLVVVKVINLSNESGLRSGWANNL